MTSMCTTWAELAMGKWRARDCVVGRHVVSNSVRKCQGYELVNGEPKKCECACHRNVHPYDFD